MSTTYYINYKKDLREIHDKMFYTSSRTVGRMTFINKCGRAVAFDL
jgi:hypothetical protein